MNAAQPDLVKEKRHWDRLTAKRQAVLGRTINEDIEELLDLGFSKRMITDLLGVGATEMMRWETSEAYLPEEKKKTARLLAFCDLLQQRFAVRHPASWFEMWLVSSCVITMQEFYYNGHIDLMLDFAAGRRTEEEVLDVYDPAWREVPPSMWEIATNADGEKIIRMRGDDDV